MSCSDCNRRDDEPSMWYQNDITGTMFRHLGPNERICMDCYLERAIRALSRPAEDDDIIKHALEEQ
jgi:hypothetical protein